MSISKIIIQGKNVLLFLLNFIIFVVSFGFVRIKMSFLKEIHSLLLLVLFNILVIKNLKFQNFKIKTQFLLSRKFVYLEN